MIKRSESSIAVIMAAVAVIMLAAAMMPNEAFAAKTPGKATLPERVYLRLYSNDLVFEDAVIPQNATGLEVWIRKAAYSKYVKTVKKNSSAYKKYKKNKKYVFKKSGSKYKVYKTISAGKWTRILRTKEKDFEYNGDTAFNTLYQLRVRGKNGKKYGKYSSSFKFRTLSKAKVLEMGAKYDAEYNELVEKMKAAQAVLDNPESTEEQKDDAKKQIEICDDEISMMEEKDDSPYYKRIHIEVEPD